MYLFTELQKIVLLHGSVGKFGHLILKDWGKCNSNCFNVMATHASAVRSSTVLPWKKKIVFSAAVLHCGFLGKHHPLHQVCWILGNVSNQTHFWASFRQLPLPNPEFLSAGVWQHLPAIKILPPELAKSFPIKKCLQEHGTNIFCSHLTPSRALLGGAMMVIMGVGAQPFGFSVGE